MFIKQFFLQLESKEREETKKSQKTFKKPPQKFYNSDEMRKIIPTIDGELKKKIEKADIVSKDKKDGIKKQPRVSILFLNLQLFLRINQFIT